MSNTHKIETSKENRVALLMSGGVDSTVAAVLLRERGFDVVGVTMKIPGSDSHIEAKKIAASLEISHHTLETEQVFTREVIEKAAQCRKRALTPNPCADCNRALKFGIVPEMISQILNSPEIKIATGHYAKIVGSGDDACLARADFREKDQSYFLCDIPRAILRRLIFPLESLSKTQVREIARAHHLEISEKPESMDTCFTLPSDFHSDTPGDIVKDQKIIGRHKGISHYTIGQRKGLGIAHTEPLYIIEIALAENKIIVGTENEAFTREVRAGNSNLLAPLPPENSLFAKTRSRGEPAPCKIVERDEKNFTVRFDTPTFAPTPGQRLVCYDERGVLVISGTIR